MPWSWAPLFSVQKKEMREILTDLMALLAGQRTCHKSEVSRDVLISHHFIIIGVITARI